MTTDPAGFEDSYNPYQYVFNNPFRYIDPNGESICGFIFGVGKILLGGALIVTGGMLEGGYAIALGFQLEAGVTLIGAGITTATYHSQDLSFPNRVGYPSATSHEYQSYGLLTFLVLDEYGDSIRVEKNDDGAPKNNSDQKKQADDAKKEIERRLTKYEKRKFHDHVTGQGYGYHELVDEGYWLLYGK